MALSLYLPVALKAEATVPIAPGKQTGLITFRSQKTLGASALEAWMKFCNRLVQELSSPKPSFLSSATCQAFGSRPLSSNAWHIELIEQKTSLEVKLHFLLGSSPQEIQDF